MKHFRWAWVATAALLLAFAAIATGRLARPEPIRVGVLHSLTGTMAISEKSVVDATLLAIEEINAAGGILGRRIEPVVADGRSDAEEFARLAEELIVDRKVCTVFGCWTSSSRRTVRAVFEKHDHLLLYPVQYEGLEASPNIVYLGAAPNQQIIPAVKWSFDNLGRRFYLVGSDYVFPRTANAIIRDQVRALGGEVVGEDYLLLGSQEVEGMVQRILAARPQVILNTINGDSNVAFFRALREGGVDARTMPTVSFSIAEPELAAMGPELLIGHYASWNYFQSIEGPRNREFLDAFRRRYGGDRVTSDPMEAAYVGVRLWAQAVADAGTDGTREIRRALHRQSVDAPEGVVYVDPSTQHCWKVVRIGRVRGDGQFDLVWDSEKPIRPVPYPAYRTKAEWTRFLDELHASWGSRWANPGK